MEHKGDEELASNYGSSHGDLLQVSKRARLCRDQGMNGLDLINSLPEDCINHIFSFLPAETDRCSCAAVSKKWLFMQANMRSSDFVSGIPVSQRLDLTRGRILIGKKASDARIAAMAVRMCFRTAVTELLIGESDPTLALTDLSLEIIARACPRLRSLTLTDSPGVGGRGLISIAHGCSGLESLNITNLPLVDDQGLIAIATACLSLFSLNLESLPLIQNESLRAFAAHSSNLRSLSLKNCGLLDDEGVISIISSLPKLNEVQLASLQVEDGILIAIGTHGESIRRLRLENLPGISELGFRLMGRMKMVELLKLKSCSGLNGSIFKRIAFRFVRLKRIVISNCETLYDDGLLGLIKTAVFLENLQLEKCDEVTIYGLARLFLELHEKLKVLTLIECQGINDYSRNLSCYENWFQPESRFLESLTINKCRGIGDGFLRWLGNYRLQVERLALIKLDSVSDAGIKEIFSGLTSHPNVLVSVDLSGCSHITDWSVFIITSVLGWRLRSLRLAGCERLTDLSMMLIAKFCRCLNELHLSSSRITDDSFPFIETLRLNWEALSSNNALTCATTALI